MEMKDNIHHSPQANLETSYQPKGSPTKAVVIASAVDIIGTLAVGVVIAMVYGAILASSGVSLEGIAGRFESIDILSPFSLTGIGLGCLITIYSGYLCAKIVNDSEYKIVSIFGAITVLFGWVVGVSYYSLVENVVFSLLTLFCVYLGAWFHVKNKHNNTP